MTLDVLLEVLHYMPLKVSLKVSLEMLPGVFHPGFFNVLLIVLPEVHLEVLL